MSRLIVTTLVFLASICISAGNVEDIASMRALADSLHAVGRTDSAAVVGARAVALAGESGNSGQIIGTNAAQGVFLRSLGRIDEALEHYGRALDEVTSGNLDAEPTADEIEEVASLYINVAVLNLDMANKDEAARYAVLAGDWVSRASDPNIRSQIYGVAGSVLTGVGQLQEAMHYQDLAYSNALEAGEKEPAFRAAAYALLIAERMGDKKAAGEWRDICRKLFDDVESTMARLVYYQVECSVNLRAGNHAEAIVYFQKILDLDGIEALPFVQLDCYNNMHMSYAGLGDYRRAYETVLKGEEVRDTLFAREKEESLRELTVRYETKEMELALARSEAEKSRTLLWLFVAVAGMLLLVIVFVVYASRQRRQRLLQEMEFSRLRADVGRRLTQQYVDGLECERGRMARELHDGVCNDLLAIGMTVTNEMPGSSAVSLIETCRESVRRISHELMPPEFAYVSLNEVLRYYVAKQSAASGIVMRYESQPAGADWNVVPDAVSLEVYRIVQEAVGNVVQHSDASQVDVKMVMQDGMLKVSVADNGLRRQPSRRGGGMASMRRRAEAVGGTVAVDVHDGGGTAVVFTVRL